MTHTTSTRLGGLGPIERAIRILSGGLLGLDFVVTGIRGFCPLYARLGIGRPHEKVGA